MNLQSLIKWANENEGFLSLVLFLATILFGWISGLFNSIIKKPKIKFRQIEKASFYSFFYLDKQFHNKELDEIFEVHQTGFSVYLSLANIGNKPTSIDKIYLGYYRNSKRKLFNRQITWLPQLHTIEDIKLENDESVILIPPLRGKTEFFMNKNDDSLEIGKSIVGVAYFEQSEAWGNYNPRTIDDYGTIKIIIKIRDVYNRNYYFKTKLKPIKIEDALRITPFFGKVTRVLK